MASGGTSPSSGNRVIYSIQRTYILNVVSTPGKETITCDQRIDIPTIEPLTRMKPAVIPNHSNTVVPCIELAGDFWEYLDLTFETNEGITVLPIKIDPASLYPSENPYTYSRYVLVLPRGATGVKSCKIIDKGIGIKFRHNFTFGIMPPPYNYDDVLFGYLSATAARNTQEITKLIKEVSNLEARVTALENKAGG